MKRKLFRTASKRNQLSDGRRGDWCYFAVFLFFGLLLAYFPLSYFLKCFLILLGVLFPLLWGGFRSGAGKAQGKISNPAVFLPPWWGWLGLLAAGIFLRFFHLLDFRPWLNGDEAIQGYFALELLKKWSWQFFYQTGQIPPLYLWIVNLFYRFSANSFFNIWFPAALFSSLCLFVAYPTARRFFEKDVSFLFTLLLAFSYWPLMAGRWGIQSTLIPFFVLAGFWLFGSYRGEKLGARKVCYALATGFWLGVGSLTYTSWLVVILTFFLLMLLDISKDFRKRFIYFLFFSSAFLLGFFPWLVAVFRERFGGYLVGVSMASGFFTWEQQIRIAVSSLTTLFWGPLGTSSVYGPVWGGTMNPILGACFFLGIMELRRRGSSSIPFPALVFTLFLFIAPCAFSADNVEVFRMIQVLPILLAVAALGLERLLNGFQATPRLLLLSSLLFLSLGLDVYHLWKPRLEGDIFHWTMKHDPGEENQQAYEIMKPVADRRGPGLIFTEYLLLSRNHSLRVATYPFNALDNSRLSPDGATWAAVVTNVHYGFLLAKRFPQSEWHRLLGVDGEDGGQVVGLLPVTAENRKVFQNWARAQAYLHQLGVESENMLNNPTQYAQVVKELPEGYPYAKGDPFLESVFSEWFAQYHQNSDFNWNIQAIQRGLQKGYPTANLYYKLGSFYYWNHEVEKSKEAYLMAAKCKPNYTNAQEVLLRIWGMSR